MSNVSSPLISIVVITYNQEKYIKRCLDGIMMQKTNFPFEVIVGEDCSTDGTRKIVQDFEREYPNVIKPIYHNENVGAARNAYEFCYSKIRGKYIAVCEGDDYWTDVNKLKKQVEFLEENPQFSLCFHLVNRVDENEIYIEKVKPLTQAKYYNWKELIHLNIPTLSLVFRNCVNGIPEEVFRAQCADVFIRGVLAKYGSAANLGFIGGNYRKHSGGVYSSRKEVDQFKSSLQSRKLMIESGVFNKNEKWEIRKEFFRRKILYMLYFIKKKQLKNFYKIALS